MRRGIIRTKASEAAGAILQPPAGEGAGDTVAGRGTAVAVVLRGAPEVRRAEEGGWQVSWGTAFTRYRILLGYQNKAVCV